MAKLKPLIKFEISALNQEDLFNKLWQNNIEIQDLRRINHSTSHFKVAYNSLEKSQKILEANNVKILNKKSLGLANLKRILLLRIGILIGILISLIMCLITSNYILQININGIERLDKTQVLQYLEQENISSFTAKTAFKTNELELKLIENFNEISMVSVIVKGGTLVLNIKEKTAEEYLNSSFNNLISNFDGRITNLTLISGTAVVKEGDLVRKGDVLVKAECYDSGGNLQKIKAEAKITAEVWSEYRYVHHDKEIMTEYTGNEISMRQVQIFGINVFDNTKNIPYENFEETTSLNKLNNVILPITIKQTIYKEVREVEVVSDFETEKSNIIVFCKQNALQNLNSSDIIKEENYTINRGEGQTSVCYIITAEREIF